MPSLRGRFFFFLLKHRHWFRFRLRETLVDWSRHEEIVRFRREAEAGSQRFGKLPENVEATPVSADGVDGEWIRPRDSPSDKVILYAHGGGYVSGSCADHRAVVAKFVRACGVPALLFEYRLAPEFPFPAAVEDTLTAYRWLLDRGTPPEGIVFMGESAGGGLALAALIAVRDEGLPLPAAAVAVSPWTDLTCSGETYTTRARLCLSPEGTWTAFSGHYVGDADPRLPWISPLYGDLTGLPPLYLVAGDHEILRDDAIAFARKAEQMGVDVRLRIGEGLFHCFPVMAPLFPEASRAMEEIGRFVRAHFGLQTESVDHGTLGTRWS